MTILVAGNAALLDFIATADRRPGPSEVAQLLAGPGAEAGWNKGGATLIATLRLARHGHDVRLWHPVPNDERAAESFAELAAAGVDTSLCPAVDAPMPCCVLLSAEEGRLAWSSRIEIPTAGDVDTLLAGISQVIFAPVWGDWADQILTAANERNIPCSLFGGPPPDRAGQAWNMIILDAEQKAASPPFAATLTCVTAGSAGARAFAEGQDIAIPAIPTTVTDTTGAGDAFAAIFMGAIFKGKTMIEAGNEAASVAAQACTHWGAWPVDDATGAVAPAENLRDRVLGALAGTACGDAFGMPNSFLQAPEWRTTMEPGPANSPYHAGYPAGRITDDTEQALALTQALEDGFSRTTVAERLNEWFLSVGGSNSLAVGPSTKRALEAYARGDSVDVIGKTGVTNGAAMRIAPIGVVAGLRNLDLEGSADLVETACWPTHATSPAISGAMAAAWPIAVAIKGGSWAEVLDAAVDGAIAGEKRGQWVYAPDIAARIDAARAIAATASSPQSLADDISRLVGAGEPCTETMPAAIAIADFAKGNPALAIEIAGNLRGDTDTIAAIAGAICGAYAGVQCLPGEWLQLTEEVNPVSFSGWAERLEDIAAAPATAQ